MIDLNIDLTIDEKLNEKISDKLLKDKITISEYIENLIIKDLETPLVLGND